VGTLRLRVLDEGEKCFREDDDGDNSCEFGQLESARCLRRIRTDPYLEKRVQRLSILLG
jgi:hypothetical protein